MRDREGLAGAGGGPRRGAARRHRALPGGLLLAAALTVTPAQAATTTSYAVVGAQERTRPYTTLGLRPGWARVVRDDLGARPQRGRSVRRRSMLYAAQLSDFQLADEESPARVEALDLPGTPFTAAWRPQEALVPQTVDQMVRQIGRFATSPVRSQRRRPVRGRRGTARRTVRATLDLALLTGDNADNQQRNEVDWVVRLLEGGRVDPDSGAPGYEGVQDPGALGLGLGLGRFYDPDAPSGDFAAFPRHPGLMDRAQRSFDAAGLPVPSYVTFGNHDGTVQGNLAANAAFEAVVTGGLKAAGTPGPGAVVSADPRRGFLSRKAYMDAHRTGRQADAHGFALVDPAEAAASGGQATYYAWSPRRGVRLIAINTVAEGSSVPGSEGNLDDPQFAWLARELAGADARGELAIVFGHHPIRTLTNGEPDEDARPCTDPTAGPGCDGDPRSSSPIRLGRDVERLLLAHRSVVAFVAGHTHEHRVTPFRRPDGSGGFWGIETASEVDWPIQSRLLELFDNRDGTLSIFGTVLDHGAAVAAPRPGTAAASMTDEELASLARELSFNDPQAGAPGGEGRPQDRNVELVLPDPRRAAGG